MEHFIRIRPHLLLSVFVLFVLTSCEKIMMKPEGNKPLLPITHSPELDTIPDSMRYAMDLPALTGAIITDTSIIDAQAVGCRQYGGALNITNNDQFNLGSNTRAITAVLIGILIDEGLLDWTTTLLCNI
jgi:CubicO group peptidase (beta-lactamase class C family)